MAAGSNLSRAELAIVRLVVETGKGKELMALDYLGPGCLATFKSVEFLHSVGTPKSNYFLVTSTRVLPKHNLIAIEKSEKKKKKLSVKIFAEFPRSEDERSLSRKPLSDLYFKLEQDIFELNGVTYVALTNKKGSSLLSRSLEVFNFSEGSGSSVLWDELQCLDFGGEPTQQERNVAFSIRAYDLLQCDAGKDSQLRKRFLKEDDFQKGDKPLGPIIVNKDCQLAGFLYFYNKNPVPLLFGSKFPETGNSPTENSCRSINCCKTMVEYVPPKNDETMQQDEIETEMPVGASGGVYPLLDPDLPSKSQVVVDEIDTKMPAGASGGVYPLLDPDLPSKSQVVVGKIDTEMPVSASGGVYPVMDPDLSSKSQVGVGEIDKSNPDSTSQLAATNQQPVEKIVAEAELNNGNDLQQSLVNGRSSNKELQEEKDLEQEQIDVIDAINDALSETSSYISFEGKVVHLPPENDKDIPPSTENPPDNGGLSCQPSSVTTKAVCERASNIPHQDRPSQRHDSLRKSYSFPSHSTKKEESARFKRSTSDLLPRLQENKRKFNPSDPLAKTILDYPELLEGLCRCLDKEYKYRTCKCWKQIAEFFDIEEQEYQNFKCSQIHSPTEVMFEYLQTCRPDITIGNVKDGLHSIAREDVIDLLEKYEETYCTLSDETLVCSLFDSDPDIIGEMAFLLDMQKKGLKNWSHLAAKLDITRDVFRTFESCNSENPTEGLFELITIHFPRSTIQNLIHHLEIINRQDVIIAVRESSEVTEDSLIKDLMEDLDVTDNVCDLLNQKQLTNKVKDWKYLGRRFGIKMEKLNDLSPIQEHIVCPTEALIHHLKGSNPCLTIANLIWAVHMIDRDDALNVLDAYLPDGCIPDLLASCDCDRCQVSKKHDRGQ